MQKVCIKCAHTFFCTKKKLVEKSECVLESKWPKRKVENTFGGFRVFSEKKWKKCQIGGRWRYTRENRFQQKSGKSFFRFFTQNAFFTFWGAISSLWSCWTKSLESKVENTFCVRGKYMAHGLFSVFPKNRWEIKNRKLELRFWEWVTCARFWKFCFYKKREVRTKVRGPRALRARETKNSTRGTR